MTNLDVTQNPNLEWFDCIDTQLTSLDVTQNLSLTNFYCYLNQLTNLDVTQNVNLVRLGIGSNNITSIDVTQNPNLTGLFCYSNQLSSLNVTQNPTLDWLFCENNEITALDLSQNVILTQINCEENQIISLDFSQNVNLTDIYCRDNALQNLNVNSGNNIVLQDFVANNNPNLLCIQVDDVNYANAQVCNGNSGWCKDVTASYSEECILGIDQLEDLGQVIFFPNPAKTVINLVNPKSVNINSITIFNVNGDLVLEEKQFFKQIDLSKLNVGMFLIKVETDKKTIVKKILVN